MKSIFNGAGYLLSDNRASDWGTKDEADLIGCGHCGALIRKRGHFDREGRYHPGWIEEGGKCLVCDQALCGPENFNCRDRVATHGCEYMPRQIEKALNDAHRREQNAKILGI